MLSSGQVINGRYEIIKLIGEGGMANVYLAFDPILKRNVAVKILRGDLSNDEKFVKRFKREAISASSLAHPNIVEIYDVGEENGNYFIVMEYVDGITLKSLIKKRGKMILAEVLDITKQVASGLECAHANSIIHRDIKPQNIMVLDDGLVKITDFGIAVASNSESLTQTNSVMGSVHYLPPEQANGTGSTVRSDIYSLGIMMFEMLTGKVPFKGETAVEIAIKQLKEPLPSISMYRDDIPQSVENIILKACAKNPENRYANVTEMLYDLDHCLDQEHLHDRKYIYKYPEKVVVKDMENEVSPVKKEEPIEQVSLLDDEIVEKPKKKNKSKVILIVLLSICSLAVIGLLTTLIFFSRSKAKDVIIPNVTSKTTEEAIRELEKAGLVVDDEILEINSSTVEEGLVVKTNPLAGRTVKTGTNIKIYTSLGAKGITLEDYKGKNYLEVKGALEAYGINVIIEKQEVEQSQKPKEDLIIKQSPEAGTELVEGNTVTLYIPDIKILYPDFTDGTYTEKSIREFCEKYNVILTVEYDENTNYPEGTIIHQTRDAGTPVTGNATFGITVARDKQEVSEE